MVFKHSGVNVPLIYASTAQQVSCPNGFAVVTLPTSRLSYECGRLQPRESYNITVAAINGAGEGERVTVSSTTACEGIESVSTVKPSHGMPLAVLYM